MLLFFSFTLKAQDKHDFIWILGYGNNLPEFFIGGNYIDFQSGNPAINYFDIPFDMDNPVVMSDSAGSLQFYSSGCNVINREHQITENGDDLNPGFLHDIWCENGGYNSYQGILGLPIPGHSGEYILFHCRRYENNDSIDVLYTLIDMNANGGLGKVTEKNKLLQYGHLSRTFQAVRHGNGRDWWIIIPEEGKDEYSFYLLDPQGVHGPFVQQVSDSWIPGQYYNLMCAFSPDGSKFVRLGGDKPTAFRLYDFDRCTGTLSNPVTIRVPDTIMYAASPCFSPNSRYLYLTNEVYRLYQYDTQASDISASVQLIGEYDGFVTVYNLAAGPHAMTMAPDNRIYLSSGNGVNVLHTIHNPDQAGTACDFRLHDILLPAHILFFLPNNPFYRLYNMESSPCDTLGVKPPMVAFWRFEEDSVSNPLNVHFTDLSYYQPTSWLWEFDDPASGTANTSAEKHPSHTFSAPGGYEVCLTVSNQYGSDTKCKTVWVVTSSTSSGSGQEEAVKVFPNPTTGEIRWEGLEQEEVTLRVYDGLGRLCLQQTTSDNRANLSALSPGLYYWQLVTSGRKVYAGKIEKQ